jgi:hypothetical protein
VKLWLYKASGFVESIGVPMLATVAVGFLLVKVHAAAEAPTVGAAPVAVAAPVVVAPPILSDPAPVVAAVPLPEVAEVRAPALDHGDPVRVWLLSSEPLKTGDVVPRTGVGFYLFTELPCPNGAGYYLIHRGMQDTGCWFPTRDHGMTLSMLHLPQAYHDMRPPEMFPRAERFADGSVRITEPDFDSRTYMEKTLLGLAKAERDAMQAARETAR